jgi:hypothetical protein
MSEVVWKPVIGFESTHDVSSDGQVRSRRRVLKQSKSNCGYMMVNICANGKQKTFNVHALVAQAFHGKPARKMQVRHLDGNKENNTSANLCYGTKSQNERDKLAHGTSNHGERSVTARLTTKQVNALRSRVKFYGCIAKWARELKVNAATISLILSGKTWRIA